MFRPPPGGELAVVASADPAAGAEFSFTVPAGEVWLVVALLVDLVTDGTAANRFAHLIADDGTNKYFESDPPEAQAASLTRTYVAGAGLPRLAQVDTVRQWGIPAGLYLPAGHRLRSLTTNLQAGDNYGIARVYVERWKAQAA